jgi:hypothetical protein
MVALTMPLLAEPPFWQFVLDFKSLARRFQTPKARQPQDLDLLMPIRSMTHLREVSAKLLSSLLEVAFQY